MSLFHCLDLLEKRLNELVNEPNLIRSVYHFFSDYQRKEDFCAIQAEKSLIFELKNNFLTRVAEDNYQNLSVDMMLIQAYFSKSLEQQVYLISIYNDLRCISDRFSSKSVFKKNTMDPSYWKYQVLPYKIAEVNQNTDYRRGSLSRGECRGYTFAMVDPTYSPYQNSGLAVPFCKAIYEYQEGQLAEGEKIKQQRLTRFYFSRDFHEQAQEILKIANVHQGKELELTIRAGFEGHSIYISVQLDDSIRYMDSNFGAYLFTKKEDVIEFYRATLQIYKNIGVNFKIYQLSELTFYLINPTPEQCTFDGKIRTLLTGPKYHGTFMALCSVLFAQLLCYLLILLLSALMVSVLMPIIGLSAFLSLGNIGLITAMIYGGLALTAVIHGYVGMLAVPYLLMDAWYSVIEMLSEPINMDSPEQQNESHDTVVSLDNIENSAGANDDCFSALCSWSSTP